MLNEEYTTMDAQDDALTIRNLAEAVSLLQPARHDQAGRPIPPKISTGGVSREDVVNRLLGLIDKLADRIEQYLKPEASP